ncbi:MAG: twin-arginine translocase subunit TatC [Candidatus Aminicenantes bacterium]|nr:twin-arginine translocase subunit TatC [Candidatus Aminicenantes bacterium]
MRKGRKSPDEMTFLEHLEDLRKRLLGSIIALLVAVIPSWMFSQDIYRILSRPVTQYLPEGTKLAFTSLTAPFTLYMKVAFLSAAFFTSPFIFYQLWKFVAPGLYQKEKKYVIPFVVFTSAFFLGGALFGYYVAFPFACRFFLNLGSEFQPVITVDTFFSLTIKLLLGIGLVFEMPTLIFFLSRMGIVTAGWMLKKFKYAILIIFVIAALITPTPDIVNQAILAVPMIVLYSLSILIALIFGKKKKPRDEDDSKQAG